MNQAGLVAAALKSQDADRYFATLLLTGPARDAVQALYAFNADIASVRERAREPTMGEIRLQWWVDALNGEAQGAARQNPLAAALLEAIAAYDLPSGALLRLIAARRFDLYDDPMPDMASFEGYAGETTSVLYQLAAMILNAGAPVETGDAAGHLGVAQALVGHLRAFGFNAAQGRLFLPLSVFAANGVIEAEIFSGTSSEGLLSALAQLQDEARDHFEHARAAIAALPKMLRPAFASIALLEADIKQVDADAPFSVPKDIPGWQKIARLTWWTLRNS